MKKHLIALGVAAAVSAPAMAQNVTVYGVIDQGFQSNANTAAGTFRQFAGGQLLTNRLGIRGAEDLGGGLKAEFQVESGFLSDVGGVSTAANVDSFQFASRGAELTLSGGFGAIKVGKAVTSDLNTAASGVFTGNLTNVASQTMATPVRPDNRMQFITPSFNGLTANVAYSTRAGSLTTTGAIIDANNESTTAGKEDGRYNSVGATYTNGPLRAMIFRARMDGNNGTGAKALEGTDTGGLIGYDFGSFNVLYRYVASEIKTVAGASQLDTKNSTLEVAVPLGNGVTISGAYHLIDLLGTNNDTDRFVATVKKDLSKRTSLYAAYAVSDNESAASAAAANGGVATMAGKDGRMFAVGVTHSF